MLPLYQNEFFHLVIHKNKKIFSPFLMKWFQRFLGNVSLRLRCDRVLHDVAAPGPRQVLHVPSHLHGHQVYIQYRLVYPDFGQPYPNFVIDTIYFFYAKSSFATILNGLWNVQWVATRTFICGDVVCHRKKFHIWLHHAICFKEQSSSMNHSVCL